jgi:hypothetical protein
MFWLLAALVPAANADEAKSSAQKPAPASARPAPAVAVKPTSKPVTAPGPATGADDEFLEFLGSVDTDSGDKDWLDYLAQTDVSKVAKAKKNTPATTEVSK